MSAFERLRKLINLRHDSFDLRDSAEREMFVSPCPLLGAASEGRQDADRRLQFDQLLAGDEWKDTRASISTFVFGGDANGTTPLTARLLLLQAANSGESDGHIESLIKNAADVYRQCWGGGVFRRREHVVRRQAVLA